MIRLAPLALGLLALAAAPLRAEDRRYPVTDYDRLIVEGPYTVMMVVGSPSSAVVSGTRAGIDRVTVDSQGTTLRIRRNNAAWGGTPGADTGPITIRLATRTLRSARLIGPGAIDVAGAAGLSVQFSVEGSGRLRAFGIDAETLQVGLLGSGRLELAGLARSLRADVQGTGDLAATALRANTATLTTTTVGTVALSVHGPVTVTANGLGAVRIGGRPICTLRGPAAQQVVCSNQP